jgi:sialate O-acetylesterase
MENINRKKQIMKKFISLTFLLCLLLQKQTDAKITMPVTFGDGMVLQRDMPIRIFGEASESTSVTVVLNGQQQTAVSNNGKWMVTFQPMHAGGPYLLQITGNDEIITFKDVMVGEVWLASGQSNMAHELFHHIDFEKFLPGKENPNLRFIQIPVTEYGEIKRDGIEWTNFNKESVVKFSSVAYFFATELQKRLKVPVGIIGSYRGGTNNEYWMTPESIKNEQTLNYIFENYDKKFSKFKDVEAYDAAYEKYLIELKEWKEKGGWSHSTVPFPPMGPKSWQRPSGLYNAMIKPLQPYTIRGCIWYQGEGNSARYEEYKTLFPAFIKGWRKTWQNPNMPFYFVQLPGFGKGQHWPQFRQVQLECSKMIHNCGMVVSEGCDDEENIHPRMKKPIGDRLAIAISAEVYGQNHIPYGPIFKSVVFKKRKAVIYFDYCGSGLVLRPSDTHSFEIAGGDRIFFKANVELKGCEIKLWSKKIKYPKYVRYAYSPNPQMALFNQEGLPASPFISNW